jgi:hypothetical protein
MQASHCLHRQSCREFPFFLPLDMFVSSLYGLPELLLVSWIESMPAPVAKSTGNSRNYRPEYPEGSNLIRGDDAIYDFFANRSLIDRLRVFKLVTERRYWRNKIVLIRYADGSSVEGTLHRLEGYTVRATVAGIDDAIDYSLVQNKWTSATGSVVTFEFTVQSGQDLCHSMLLRGRGAAECAAGGDCALRRMSGSCPGTVN